MKIIQINGFRGLINAVFIGMCLFAGFVVFPGIVFMHLWNLYLVNLVGFPVLNIFQGSLLWGIVAVSYFILFKGGEQAIAFKHIDELSKSEVDRIIRDAKVNAQLKKINREIQKTDKFQKNKENILNISATTEKEVNTVISSSDNKSSDSEETLSNFK